MAAVSKYYKPEILICPKCGSKLVYRHSVSSKFIYFTNGKHRHVCNLGYSCSACQDNQIYFSQTANKLAFKGYTYSAKIVCLIAILKENHKSREEICDYFFTKNIEISDRNIDNLYEKYLQCINYDYQERLTTAYARMLEEFGQIRLSIDLITVLGNYFIIVYDYFSSDILSFVRFESWNEEEVRAFLSHMIQRDLNITVIASIRKDAFFIPLLKSLCPPHTKFISYTKY